MKRFLVFFWFISLASFAQSNLISGWLPKVNLSTKISNKTKWVNSIETREVVFRDKLQFSYSLVDVSTIFSFKIDVNQSLNTGYIIRFKDGETVHRLLQHYNIVQSFTSSKLAHRLGFEQFFKTQQKPQYRTRYRATFQQALNGEKVDVKEWYFKLSNEYLYQFNKENFEVRLSPYFGYQLSKNDKLEFGFDYRLGKILDNNQTNNLWFRTTWYISI